MLLWRFRFFPASVAVFLRTQANLTITKNKFFMYDVSFGILGGIIPCLTYLLRNDELHTHS